MKKSPYFVISDTISDANTEDNGEYFTLITIEQYDPDGSCAGCFDFFSLDHLLKLRDEINYYIQTHTDMAKKNKINQLPPPIPAYCRILEGYLKGWAPVQVYEKGTVLKTSQDIVNDIEDMTDIDTYMVSEIMSHLGFRTHFCPEGMHGWMMRRDPAAVHTILPQKTNN